MNNFSNNPSSLSRSFAGSIQPRRSRGDFTARGDVTPKGFKLGQMQNFTPEQMQLFGQMFSQVDPESYLSQLAGGDQSFFDEMEEPAMRQFSALQGNLASRFSGMGMGARRSSGFQNTMNQASNDFASDLASRRQALQRQAIMDLQGLSNSLLGQRPFERFMIEKDHKPSFMDQWLNLAGNVMGNASNTGFLGGLF